MDNKLLGGLIGTTVSVSSGMLANISVIVSIIGGVLGILITIVTNVVIPLIQKYKAAKKDGKITTEEIEDMLDTIKTNVPEVVDKINDLSDEIKKVDKNIKE